MAVLSLEEAELIKASWKLLEKDIRGHGIRFFSHIFMNYPDIQSKFFPMMDTNDVARLGSHGTKVMQGVGSLAMLAASDRDDNKLIEKVKEITNYHNTLRVGTAQFKVVNKCLLEYLVESLGSNLSSAGAAAWKKLLDTVQAIIDRELQILNSR